MNAKQLGLDLAAFAAAGGFMLLAWRFWQSSGALNTALAAVLAFGALRIAYEMTLNRHSVPTIASAPAVRRKIAELIAADCRARGDSPYNVFELGAGKGELARTIARALREMPQARVTGIELAAIPFLLAALKRHLLGPDNLSFRYGSFFDHNFSEAAAVTLFLGKLTGPAGEVLWRDLLPGSLVLSNDFKLDPPWQCREAITIRTPFKTVLYVYRR